MTTKMTLQRAAAECRALGYTLRRMDGELVAYPVGTSMMDPRAIFPIDYDDAVGTVRAEVQHERNNRAFRELAEEAAATMRATRERREAGSRLHLSFTGPLAGLAYCGESRPEATFRGERFAHYRAELLADPALCPKCRAVVEASR